MRSSGAVESAHDRALQAAVEEVRPHFHQCSAAVSGLRTPAGCTGRCARCARLTPRGDRRDAAGGAAGPTPRAHQRDGLRGEINVKDEAVVVCPHCGAKAARRQVLQRVRKAPQGRGRVPEVRLENAAGAKFCSSAVAGLTDPESFAAAGEIELPAGASRAALRRLTGCRPRGRPRVPPASRSPDRRCDAPGLPDHRHRRV